jgi:ribosome modulation factor
VIRPAVRNQWDNGWRGSHYDETCTIRRLL